ncbi:MAG: alpha/beta hydrolase-fold protein [Bacteroidota bacterium]
MKKLLLSLILISLIFSLPAQEGKDINIGKSYVLKSEILKEERPFSVYLPAGYSPTGNPTPVMYLLDGDYHFHHTTGVVHFLSTQGRMPEMIVVAIPNTTDRTRDLTPEIIKDDQAKKNFPTGGKANSMLSFIKDELMPHIDKQYNTSPYTMLIGHSFGGIFAVNAFLEEPDLFDSYISISPSMWWDDQSLVEKAEKFLDKKPNLNTYFYMTMGNEGGTMLGGAMKLAALFEEYEGEDFSWDFKVMEEETHGSVPHRSTYYGLEKIFKDWYSADVVELYQSGGMEALEKHYNVISEKLGYKWVIDEGRMNTLGYQLMGRGKLVEAKEVFAKNIEEHPKSFNTYDSMAEAYMSNKENDKAIDFYKKSLAINPGNANGVAMLKKLGVEYDPMSMKLKLSAKKLKKYTGKYKTQMGVVEVSIVDDKLMAEVKGGFPQTEMIPFPDDVFMIKPLNSVVQFEVNEKDEVNSFTAQQGIGQMMKGVRLEGAE